MNVKARREQFEANPARFLETVIKGFVTDGSYNRLPSFNDDAIFDNPLVGFADGHDSLFQEYKRIIGNFHFTPREALEKHVQIKGQINKRTTALSVISFVLPITYETRLSVRRENTVASLRWNHTRHYGQQLIDELSLYLVSLLEGFGYDAVAPELANYYEFRLWYDDPGSNWSQRHVAYAAGLGTFSLNDGLITPKGIAHRCGSVVTNLAFKPSPRVFKNHLDNCLHYRQGTCVRCIKRCPVGAISENGHDKKKCREFMAYKQKEMIEQMGRKGYYLEKYLICGLCQTKVPCESMIPPSIKSS